MKKLTFDDRLERLVADATPDQLLRMRDIAALQLRIMERQREAEAKRKEPNAQ